MAGKKIIVRREKKQPSASAAAQTTSFFEELKGKKIVIQSRAGTRYEGLFEAYKDGFFWLKDAEIVGHTFRVKTDLVAIDRGQTAHLHLEPKEVEKISED
ncbi:MAG: hypothetical protein GXO17_01015 [Thermodesulfobacteria bacterium]|nr:hypothetical protein [Thermodesulfobacteriota bacterium]